MRKIADNKKIAIGRVLMTISRFPFQEGYNWRGMTKFSAPLNYGDARFGGGWKYKLGVSVGGSTVILDLLFGMVRLSILPKLRDYKCVQGHDLCHTMTPSSTCPYCEVKP